MKQNIGIGDWVAFMSDGVLTIGLVLYTIEDTTKTTILTHCGEVNVNSIREVRAGKS